MVHPRILLADAHGVVRQGLRTLLRPAFKQVSFVETETSAATVAASQRENLQLIVLALKLPDYDGLATLRQCTGAPILVFTAFSEEQMGVAAIAAGASGYLCKTATNAEVVTAVTIMLEGRESFSPLLRELLARHRTGGARLAGLAALSNRERAALREFDHGCTVKEAAARLGLGASTVSTYRGRIMRKLGLRTANELVRCLAEHRLHSP